METVSPGKPRGPSCKEASATEALRHLRVQTRGRSLGRREASLTAVPALCTVSGWRVRTREQMRKEGTGVSTAADGSRVYLRAQDHTHTSLCRSGPGTPVPWQALG